MRRVWKVLRVERFNERGKLRRFGGNHGGQDGVRRAIWAPKWCWRWYTGQDELHICAVLHVRMLGEGRKGGTKRRGADVRRERHGKGLRVIKCTEWAGGGRGAPLIPLCVSLS